MPPDLKKIDGYLSRMNIAIVEMRAGLSRLDSGVIEMGEALTIAQKANLVTAIRVKGAVVETVWAAIKQEWLNP